MPNDSLRPPRPLVPLDRPSDGGPEVSVVIPLYNEEANVEPLLDELFATLEDLGKPFEVICVDDGSRDGTWPALQRSAEARPALRVLRFRRNFGQTAAMSAGIEAARGAVILPMDGDLQNDPADIGRLLQRLDGRLVGQPTEPVEVVSGWRRNRQDRELGRKLPSRLANWLISAVSGVRLHDYGCSLKAYRRDVISGVRLYGEMHRFIPVYASWQGARVAELVVNHRPRRSGSSKYGLGRTGKVLLDLLVVKFLASYTTKPIYLFGGFGLMCLALALASAAAAVVYKLLGLKDLVQTPLPLLAVALALAGLLGLLMGLLAELVVRTYYEAQEKRPYLISSELNAPRASPAAVDRRSLTL
ncbi:MAG: glycosyltransferase family 2 protein [Myxococcaceae bacterium]